MGGGRDLAAPLSRQEHTIPRAVSCSDFRLASHVSHSRTERHLSLASQHAVAADERRGPDLARGWMASMAQGARGCGWSKHESGPHRHSLQLLCLHQVPARATSRERELPTCTPTSQREARQTAAVSRCVSELHGKKYRILEVYVFAARKPVPTCRGALQGQR